MKSPTQAVIDRLPNHLKQFVVHQNYEHYTPINHAVWRYFMRVGYSFLKDKAHESYVQGLKKTGIGIDRIPNIDVMNTTLSKIGWGAVCVDGFIPPNAFMEFQAYQVLVIAADIRSLEHIEYTPAPDIIHEAAGHAPIIGDPEYAEYLRFFGEIGSKAISNPRDKEIYEAIRKLSILKENPNSSDEEVEHAEKDVLSVQNKMRELSEMAQIRNLHWWTVEYGLVGDINNPKIYGAGLLSSIGESMRCLLPEVKKLPYSLDAAEFNFDITSMQPQLFVSRDFAHLTEVLDAFADRMALRTGGLSGIEKAIESEEVATAVLSSGIQISGKLGSVRKDSKAEVAYIQAQGPSMLCENNQEIWGHGTSYHQHGYGTPVGDVIGLEKPLENYRLEELSEYGIEPLKVLELKFTSGVIVHGKLDLIRKNCQGKILMMSFSDCRVTFGEEVLFEPEWGVFDMAVGAKVISVFAGAADKTAYLRLGDVSATKTPHEVMKDDGMNTLYQTVADIREGGIKKDNLKDVIKKLERFPDEWLIRLEILELVYQNDPSGTLMEQLEKELDLISTRVAANNNLISNGIKLLK